MKITKTVMEEVAKQYFVKGKSIEEIINHFGIKDENGRITQLTEGQVLHCIDEMQYKYSPVIIKKNDRAYKESLVLSLYEQLHNEKCIAERCNCSTIEVCGILRNAFSNHQLGVAFHPLKNHI